MKRERMFFQLSMLLDLVITTVGAGFLKFMMNGRPVNGLEKTR